MSRSDAQLGLPFTDLARFTPAQDRVEPRLWVRRLVIWGDVSKKPVRDLTLHRGLNIVWSPVSTKREAPAIGHAAGKSLLCRLLRHCLGEESFADSEDTAAIRNRFPKGAVGAEIRLQGETWAVRRPFGARAADAVARVERLEDVGEGGALDFRAFVEAIEETVFERDNRQLLADVPGVAPWPFVLAWLSRDQECRIDGLLNWRHPESSSHSPVRNASAEVRIQVLRVALGLYSTHARELREELLNADATASELEAARQELDSQFRALHREVARALELDVGGVWPPPMDLLESEVTAHEKHRAALVQRARERIRAVAVIRGDDVYHRDAARLAELNAHHAELKAKTAAKKSNRDIALERVKLLDGEEAKKRREAREAKYPTCPYDDTPLDVEASKFACPLVQLPDSAAAKQLADEAKQALDEARAEWDRMEEEYAHTSRELAAVETEIASLSPEVEAHQAAMSARTRAGQAAWAAMGHVDRLFELRAELDAATRASAEAADAARALQKRYTAALSDFSLGPLEKWFGFLVRRVVAPQARGRVHLDADGLHPEIEWRGRRRSVALNSLRIVLFDMAAMLCAAEGHSCAPAFLLHDSPREGDLDVWTYGRIFKAALELGPSADEAPFQYIITTTTDPPREPEIRDRVRLKLGSRTKKDRLFKADL